MKLYKSEGHRSIEADGLNDAGEKFASIKANRLGRRGTVGTCRLESWSRDGSSGVFGAYIGTYDKTTRTTSGKNVSFVVTRTN